MNAEEDDMGAHTISDGVEQATKMLAGTRASLQRQRWRTHVGHVMSCLATMDSMVLDSVSSGDDDDDYDGSGQRDDSNDAVRPASIPLVHGIRGSP
jgi:hypothetical protein